MILSCQNIVKSFGTDVIIKGGSFHLEEHEKAAIVGINGAGKTTLLRMIAGESAPDSGTITLSKGRTLGYLKQHQDVNSTATIYEELLCVKEEVLQMERRLRAMELEMKHLEGEKLQNLMEQYNRVSTEFEHQNGYAVQSEVTGVLKGLGFTEDEFSKQICTLSGGQKTRVALGRLLLSAPDVLLLDEPINHLDLTSIAWLETYLLGYSGAVLIVAHDRYFLNRVASKIIELDNGWISSFSGNYSDYAEKKAQLRETAWKAYLNQQQEIRHQEAVIAKLKSFNREKSIRRAESREKMLEKIEVLDKPSEIRTDMHLHFSPQVTSGNDVLKVEHLSKSFPGNPLFSDLCFTVSRGERIAIIGDNGTGKTTILKILNELEPADSGTFTLGSKVHIGYYDQEHQLLHMDKTLIEEISDVYPDMTGTQIRNVLASFLFTGDDVFKRVRDLSGGERGRLSLAKLMLSQANFLILDEPTNHLDITSKEILEEALRNYTGTVLYVSHDRYFINRTATRILELKNQTLINYIGNYDYYLEKVEELTKIYAPVSEPAAAPAESSGSREDWARQKEAQARERKRHNELKKTEDRIAALEERSSEIDTLLTQEEVFTDVAKCMELGREKAALTEELDALYEQWEALCD
ncbi:ABC transporter ATP-binding protein [Parablautia sp. Marseille-Q6255]|uniref:ABC transporter ATP-binding protein n=1 Tax=Parablautia sp. Marseille-Q6255 TaxID=3039593 RepID=UPI0024BD3202|nr:ATP-binding cassette domain-containing protein [Parablautia sp. Marseille-Q6255]